MDAVSMSMLLAALSRLVDGAMDGVGGQAWDSLVKLVSRRRRQGREVLTAMRDLEASPDDRQRLQLLASALELQSRGDPEFAAKLRNWCDQVVNSSPSQLNINSVSGTVHGPVVQAQDIYGGVNFGKTERD